MIKKTQKRVGYLKLKVECHLKNHAYMYVSRLKKIELRQILGIF